MRPIYENNVIQIEVTNGCHLSCRHCTRHVGHHRKPFFMKLEMIEQAIDSLEDFPGRVGCMGGEPALHPKFTEILDLFERKLPPERREFWTAGFRWGTYEKRIREVFPRVNYNDHILPGGRHTPMLVAIAEVVADEELRAELISNCSFQSHWSASITPKGGFFCEVAASLDWLFDGPGGYPIEPGWWDKTPEDFQDQVAEYCRLCSGAIPMPAFSDGQGARGGHVPDYITPLNVERLRALGSPKVLGGHYRVWTQPIDRDWVDNYKDRNLRSFRDFMAFEPEDVARQAEIWDIPYSMPSA